MQTAPVEDSVAKVNNEVAVGSDLRFQKKWWKFERVIWTLFTLIVILDVLGCFGKGWLANARASAPDGSLDVKYERVQRFSTPSRLEIGIGPDAIRNGAVQLWVSENLVKTLGNQRVIPQPASSVVGAGGILYTFPATTTPASVEFSLEPGKLGPETLEIRAPGFEPVRLKIFVMP